MTIVKEYTNEQLVMMVQETGDEVAFNDLYLKNKGLIGSVIRKFNYIKIIDKEDLEGQCYIGFTKAVKQFDASKGYKFSSYCHKLMTNSILRVLAELNRSERKTLYANTSYYSEGDFEEFCNKLSGKEAMYTFIDHSGAIDYAFNELKGNYEKYKPYVIDLLTKTKTQLEVANELGVTKQMVGFVLKKFKNDAKSVVI